MKKILMLFTLFLLTCTLVIGQTVQISGTVTSSEDGLPLPGVTVTGKGTTLGTTTGVDGKYSISLPATSQSILFSFVGFTQQEILINKRTVINVVMTQNLVQMNEVVVTAMGISREKKALGYAVQEVSSEQLSRGNNSNLSTALSGKIAGLEVRQSSGMPGAPSQVTLRGSRSFSGDNTPLYVVDGMPITSESDYSSNVTGSAYASRSLDIDPNDIESINVLKGQSAAALYGMRASNGVIIITTKSGKNNAFGKPVITFNEGYSMDQISVLPELQQTYGAGANFVYAPVGSFSWGPKIEDLPNAAVYGGTATGLKPGYYWHAQKGDWVLPQAYNTPKDFFGKGYANNTSINISQAGQFGSFSIGLGSTNQTGIVASTSMDRYTGKMAANFNVTQKLKVGFTGNYSDSKLGKLPSGNDSWLFVVFGSPINYDLVGTPYTVPTGDFQQYRQTSYRTGTVAENPLWATKMNRFTEATKRFFGNTNVEYDFTSWAKVKYQLGVDTYNTHNEDMLNMGSAGAAGVLPTAGQYTTPTNPVYAYIAPSGGKISKYGIERRMVNSLLTASFNHTINDLKMNLMVGNEIIQDLSNSYSMTGSTFAFPGWPSMSNAQSKTGSTSTSVSRTVGFFGDFSADYKGMAFFNATARNDVASGMPRGNRSFFYPSASLGFLFTELSPLKNNPILSYGKVRASVAQVGQAGRYVTPYYGLSSAGSGFLTDGITFPLGGVNGYAPNNTLYDPSLKPQNTRTYEVGTELRFLNNRISLDYSYSDQLAKGQIFAVPLAGSTGFGSLVMNAGKMSSKTNELTVMVHILSLKNINWRLSVNYTQINNKVLELAPGVENISLGGFTTPNIRAAAGASYPAIYGESWLRNADGKLLIQDDITQGNYGFPIQGPFKKIGDVSPKFIMSFNSGLDLWFVSLNAQIDWKNGGDIYSGSNRLANLYGTTKVTEDRNSPFIIDGVKNSTGAVNDIARGGATDPLGQANAMERLYTGLYSSVPEANVYENSFVKLREISLSINIPKELTRKVYIQNANISFFARNILLWSTLPNFDPETSQGQGNSTAGMDYVSLPQTKTVGIGLNLTF
jgi:TonB-linked SusC/RagA family outer membrane protein